MDDVRAAGENFSMHRTHRHLIEHTVEYHRTHRWDASNTQWDGIEHMVGCTCIQMYNTFYTVCIPVVLCRTFILFALFPMFNFPTVVA